MGWEPELSAKRITQLGDAAVTVPWDSEMRHRWREKVSRLPPAQESDADRDYLSSAEVLADFSFAQLLGTDDDRFEQIANDPPRIRPATRLPFEIVAIYPRGPLIDFKKPDEPAAMFRQESDYSPGLGLTMQLAVPVDDDEATFDRVLDLIGKESFKHARRRLWSWESEMPATASAEDAQKLLAALVHGYNKEVEIEIKAARFQSVFLFVPTLLGLLPGIVGNLGGLGIDVIKGRFPSLQGQAVRASHHPGSAVEGLLSVFANEERFHY